MKLHYGWVIVAVGALSTCVAMGSAFSLGVFLTPMATDTGWSRTGVSSAMTIVFIAMAAASFLWGWLSDRYGARLVVLLGAIFLGLGLAIASRATSLLEFQLLFGVLIGAAGAAFYVPLSAAAAAWFDKNPSLAVALVSAGMGVAPMVVSPFATWLIGEVGWRTAMLIVGGCAAGLVAPASLLLRKPPLRDLASRPAGATGPVASAPMTAGQAFRTPSFVAIALTHFACCACHSGPIFHMVAYAIGCGIAPMVAASIYGVAGLSGLGGRIVFGLAADRFGVKHVLVLGLIVQAVAAGSYVFVGQTAEFYGLAVIFALAYGGVMPLYAILVRDYFGLHIMGTVFGAVSAAASLGMAFGPVAGGWVFDTYANYNWLYIGSFAVGLGAVAIALTVKPVAKPPEPRAKLQPA
ncbi:MAG TPA: MFS transporter [Reyranellaceae bacterium]|nr:MFS transporter [Reyranellaceae bacterium]